MAVEPGSSSSTVVRHGPYPEFTWTAVLVGWSIGALIAISIGYAALILGFTIEGSELAAILGWGILRGVMRRTSIVENNINQTIASAVNGASSGIMFTVPALFILSQSPGLESVGNFDLRMTLLITFAGITGCVLGLAFVIPLRKQMIDFDRLAYPGGIAVATILKSPGAGIRKAVLLLLGAAVSGIAQVYLIWRIGAHPDWAAGQQFGFPSMLNVTFFLSLMTVGVGFLSGKGGFWFGAGGFICYFILAPLLSIFGPEPTRQLIDPAVRPAIVQADNRGAVGQAIQQLRQFDLPAAQALSQATGVPLDEDADPQTPSAPAADSRPTVGTMLDPAIASALIAAADRLRSQADSVRDAPEQRTLGKTADELLAATRANQVRAALAAMDTLSAQQRDELAAASNAHQVLDMLQAARDLDPAERSAIAAATWSADRYWGVPETLRLQLYRPTGIGMLIGAAIAGILLAFPLIRSAFRSMHRAATQKSSDITARNDEMPIRLLYLAIIAGAGVMVAIAFVSVEQMTLGRAALMAVLGTLWVWVAGVIVAECVGRTNWSPLSGMTLIAVTILILIAKTGLDAPQAVVASIVVGAAICLAISQASDMMLDLKSGYLIGAIPRRQQLAQFVGAWLGPGIVVLLMLLLHSQYTIGSDMFPAPQATALASTMDGIINDNVPSYRYLAGAGLGALLALSGLGGIGVLVGLGFYMPFDIVLTYTAGNVLRVLSDTILGKRFGHEVGIPIAAGLIVGEALVGVGNALITVGWQFFNA